MKVSLTRGQRSESIEHGPAAIADIASQSVRPEGVAPFAWHYDEEAGLYVTVTGSHITDIQISGVSPDRSGNTAGFVFDQEDLVAWQSRPFIWSDSPNGEYMGQASPVSCWVSAPDRVCLQFIGEGSPEGERCMTVRG